MNARVRKADNSRDNHDSHSNNTNPNRPRGWKSSVLGAAAVAALLASTACQSSAAGGSGEARPSDRPSATGSAKPDPTSSAKPGRSESAKPSSGSGKTGGGDGGGGKGGAIAACAGKDLSFSLTNEDGKGKPVRHLLLTVTNTGDKKCTLHHYPVVRLGADAQAPTPVIKDSDPKALATLAPGEEAHAALLVSGGARDEYEAKSITVTLQGSKPGSHAGEPVGVDLPGVDTLYADDGQLVTYWMTASGLALRFIMSS
ncbi:DUF4232 domain-containing protein [Streptomyces sp. NPDC085481]|uniref:DUF4232 domain-containing protein n=1 Tax=Streptomyces sp. NPDC085481 TaxID=3365727 RepID=UPI0037CFFEB5